MEDAEEADPGGDDAAAQDDVQEELSNEEMLFMMAACLRTDAVSAMSTAERAELQRQKHDLDEIMPDEMHAEMERRLDVTGPAADDAPDARELRQRQMEQYRNDNPHLDPTEMICRDSMGYPEMILASKIVPPNTDDDVGLGYGYPRYNHGRDQRNGPSNQQQQLSSSDDFRWENMPLSEEANAVIRATAVRDMVTQSAMCLIDATDETHGLFGVGARGVARKYAIIARAEGEGNAALLGGQLVEGIPVRSPLYWYQLELQRPLLPQDRDWYVLRKRGRSDDDNDDDDDDEYTARRIPVWQVKRCRLIRRPLSCAPTGDNPNSVTYGSSSLVHWFARECARLEGPQVQSFVYALQDQVPELQDELSPMGEDLTWWRFHHVMEAIGLGHRLVDRPMPEAMRYIYCPLVERLREFYDDRILLNMQYRHLEQLHQVLTEDPVHLFFFRTSPFLFRVVRELNGGGGGRAEDMDDEGHVNLEADALQQRQMDSEADWRDEQARQALEQLVFNREMVAHTYRNYQARTDVTWLYIPELHIAKLDLLPENLPGPEDRALIRMYDTLKANYYVGGHACSMESELRAAAAVNWLLPEDGVDTDEAKEEVETRLLRRLCTEQQRIGTQALRRAGLTHTIAKEHNGFYYLNESWIYNKAFAQSMALLFRRNACVRHTSSMERDEVRVGRASGDIEPGAAEYVELPYYVEPVTPRFEVTGLAAEQVMPLEMIRAGVPLIEMDGMGGTGKTFVIQRAMEAFPPGATIAITFQGRNMVNLQGPSGNQAFTYHHFITTHQKCCFTTSWHNSNVSRRRNYAQPKEVNGTTYHVCPFENVRVVIFEELGNTALQLPSIALSILSQCAKLQLVLMCGGFGQLYAIAPGRPLHDAAEFCSALGLDVHLRQQHRIDPGSELFHATLQAVYEGRAEDVVFDGHRLVHQQYCNDAKNCRMRNPQYGERAVELAIDYDLRPQTSIFMAHSRVVMDSINPALARHYAGKGQKKQQDSSKKKSSLYKQRKTYRVGDVVSISKNAYIRGNTLANGERLQIVNIWDYAPGKRDRDNPENVLKDYGDTMEQVESTKKPIPRGKQRKLEVQSLGGSGGNSKNKNTKKRKGSARKYIPYWYPYNQRLRHAYCTTVHGTQGTEVDETAVLVVPYTTQQLYRNHVYTWMSRTKALNPCTAAAIYLGDWQTLLDAVRRPQPPRFSQLPQLVLEAVEPYLPPYSWRTWQPSDIYYLIKSEEDERLAAMPKPCTANAVDAMHIFLDEQVMADPRLARRLFGPLRAVCKRMRDMVEVGGAVWRALYRCFEMRYAGFAERLHVLYERTMDSNVPEICGMNKVLRHYRQAFDRPLATLAQEDIGSVVLILNTVLKKQTLFRHCVQCSTIFPASFSSLCCGEETHSMTLSFMHKIQPVELNGFRNRLKRKAYSKHFVVNQNKDID